MSAKEHLCGHEWLDVSIHESPPRRRTRCIHCGIEGVEAPQLVLRSQKFLDSHPTTSGMYWWRKSPDGEPEIVLVRWWLGCESKDSECDHLRVYRFERGDGEYNNQLENFSGQWAGPLEPPI